jgi:hypothetical protein
MDPSLQPLLDRLDLLTDEFGELRDGIRKAVRIAGDDPEMALTRVRKVLELVVREVYGRRCQEPPGTRPLENLLQRIAKDGYLPARLAAYASTVRELGNVGTHRFGEGVTAADVSRSLSHLDPILEWYFKSERPDAIVRKPSETRPRSGSMPPLRASPPRPSIPAKEIAEIEREITGTWFARPADKPGAVWREVARKPSKLSPGAGEVYGLEGYWGVRDRDLGTLSRLGELSWLRGLSLKGCWQVTDAGLAHLRGLTLLRELDLYNCKKVTDAGLVHLTGLTALERVELSFTPVTDAGLAKLRVALPKCSIFGGRPAA